MSMFKRLYTTVAETVTRKTVKPLASRKTYLVDTYTHLLRQNAVVLAVHNSTLLKHEDKQLRRDIAKAGGQLTVVRSNLMRVALRGLESEDPASRTAAKQYRRASHPMVSLFSGPSAVVTVPELDPAAVDRVVQIIDRSQNRLVLLGGQVAGQPGLVLRREIETLRKLPTIEELRAQLAGVLTVLGGAGLTQTLASSSQTLYLTLDAHRQSEAEKSE